MAIIISFGQIIGQIIDSVNEIHEVVMAILGPLDPNLEYTISTAFLVPRSTLCDPVIGWNGTILCILSDCTESTHSIEFHK